ncbi:MFS transporter [Streptomyces sp. BB1-1-1]|uniref:MFS transporter n=1 Tax=Streptomyces sp. BB1-1-1 TaxID=3074430 RepID=UPI002877D751|nr:MFS transporter [Streptomyces sp. BB1-1-1]WND39738.1 MFS transporter [Streptomyces sp. BB1-1-1]
MVNPSEPEKKTAGTDGSDAGEGAAAGRTRWATVAVSALATLLVASELSMAAFALPLIAADLDVTGGATAWVLLAYQLPLAALALPAGRWVDRSDPRPVFAASLILVAAASVLASAAPQFWLLLLARVLQGVAAAAYLAVYLPVVPLAVRPGQRGRAMSYHATIMMVGSIAVAPLGGWLADAYGWRAVIWAKAPLLLAAAVLGLLTVPARARAADNSRPAGRALAGDVLLVGAAVTAALLAIEQSGHRPAWATVFAVLALALAAGWTRLDTSRPVLMLLRRGPLGWPTLALTLNASVIGLITFLLPFFISDVMHRGPGLLSTALVFFIATSALITPLAGLLADRFRPLPVAAWGGALTVAALLPMLTLAPDAGLTDLAWRMVLLGIGMALFNSPNMTAILDATPDNHAGTVGGLTNLARTLGTTLGPALAALGWTLGSGGTSGFRGGVWALSLLTLVAFAALLAAVRAGRSKTPVSFPAS